jgi:hypothetical protein
MPPQKLECPKCYKCRAWFERDGPDTVLRSMCGVHTIVATEGPAHTVIEHAETSNRIVRLPQPGSALSATLGQLAIMEPANSLDVTQSLALAGRPLTVGDVSSYLTILRVKGLVIVTDQRRGMPGGSTWALSITARKLLGVQ